MDAYEYYLNNIFRPYDIQNNPFEVGNEKTQLTPDWDVSSQVQGELANRPHYDASGRRYGSTLSDDMFDIKNGRRGNPETSNHPWIGGLNDYNMGEVPVLEAPKLQTAIQEYINSLTTGDIKDRSGRKKFVGEGGNGIVRNDYEDYDPEMYSNPDYEQYLTTLNDYNALREKQAILQGRGTGYDGIGDDVRYIKSGGTTLHEAGWQTPSYAAEYDPLLGTTVSPDRLSPMTAKMIAQGMTQDREEPMVNGESVGLNPIINAYRRRLSNGFN
jgi:hypothetical protein